MKALHITTTRIIVLAALFGSFFWVQPVYAQTAQEQYRSTLIQLIELLQAQITELQLQLQQRQSNEYDDGLLGEIEGQVLEVYTVTDMQLFDRAPSAYQAYLDQMEEILPSQYDRSITELVIFTDGDPDVSAYVETVIPYDGSWRYAIRQSEIEEDPEDDASVELMIHEFAHIWSLDQVFADGLYEESCHSYFDDSVCYGTDSYLGLFVSEFWDYQMLTDLESVKEGSGLTQDEFYDRYANEFVSDYAATDPAEDFAESFIWYVLDLPTDTRTAERKVDFFDQYDFTRVIASEINANI